MNFKNYFELEEAKFSPVYSRKIAEAEKAKNPPIYKKGGHNIDVNIVNFSNDALNMIKERYKKVSGIDKSDEDAKKDATSTLSRIVDNKFFSLKGWPSDLGNPNEWEILKVKVDSKQNVLAYAFTLLNKTNDKKWLVFFSTNRSDAFFKEISSKTFPLEKFPLENVINAPHSGLDAAKDLDVVSAEEFYGSKEEAEKFSGLF